MPFPTWNTHDLHRYSRALPGVNPTLLWWQAGMKTWETMFAAPQVIAQRTARMAAAGPFPGARDRREFTNMGTEKVIAFSQAWMGAAREIFVWQQEMANVASRQCWELMRAFNLPRWARRVHRPRGAHERHGCRQQAGDFHATPRCPQRPRPDPRQGDEQRKTAQRSSQLGRPRPPPSASASASSRSPGSPRASRAASDSMRRQPRARGSP